tara:strand:+ start:1559 stop:2830 length:1272 start_codon:yes stop_codon:yes gene_type:complete
MKKKKIKVLTLGDMPLGTSGVGNQSRFFIEALLQTGKFEVFTLGGAIKHPEYKLMKTEQWGDDWKILPVDKFGTKELIRSILWREKPDLVWIMTDPRFWGWLWEMDTEIRKNVPIVYYHVWDNYPYPKFNKKFYECNDVIVSISKLTNDIVKNVAPKVELHHVPHAVNTNIFKNLGDEARQKLRKENKSTNGDTLEDKFIILFNSRNARRKHTGTLVFWFKEFLDRVGHNKAVLLMHTEPTDPNGPDLLEIIRDLELDDGQVIFSRDKVDEKKLAALYNISDILVNISDAEGFGLSCLESLACERPVIVNKTGGLQEQVADGEKEFGVGLEPSSKMVVGSQLVPYVGEDRISKEEFIGALEKLYNMTLEERQLLGLQGRAHVIKNYSFEDFNERWPSLIEDIHKRHGSWNNRKKYKTWKMEEL